MYRLKYVYHYAVRYDNVLRNRFGILYRIELPVLNIFGTSSKQGKFTLQLYCRPPGFTLMPQGKCLAGGLQSGCTANSTGMQYKLPLFRGGSKED